MKNPRIILSILFVFLFMGSSFSQVISESAKYTIVLRTLIENGWELFQTGDDAYPIAFETHRDELNKKIIDRYYFDEIGHETEERFKHRFNTKMREIMPFYNLLYNSFLGI